MSSLAPHPLYDLLPAVYRVRDSERGEVLHGLLEVIQKEYDVLEADLERLYDNWFIETCEEWVVPYIGDLLGVRGLFPVTDGVFSERGFVANTLAYRRAKGTAAVLEQLAHDLTGWPAKAVEYFQLLATTRAMNHERSSDVSTVEIRNADASELVGTPLEHAAHTLDVRHIDTGRGLYNIRNVGIHLWRLQPYYLRRAGARAVHPVAGQAGRFTIDPLGKVLPLFNVPRAELSTAEIAGEPNLPGRLRRRPLYEELERRRQTLVDGEIPDELYFDAQPAVRVWVDGAEDPVPPEQIVICNLGDRPASVGGWRRPATHKDYRPTGGGAVQHRPITVAVDPELGRIAFPYGVRKSSVEVGYAYGFPGDVGGGPYRRDDSVGRALRALEERPTEIWQRGITTDTSSDPRLRSTLSEAVEEWNALPAGASGVIAIMDSRSYDEDLVNTVAHQRAIEIKANSRLVVVAAQWPFDEDLGEALSPQRTAGRLVPRGVRPHLRGRIEIKGTASARATPGSLVLNGLLVEQNVTVLAGNLGELQIAHCTLPPRTSRLRAKSDAGETKRNDRLMLTLERSITGPLRVEDGVAGVRIVESVVHGRGGAAIEAPKTTIDASTIVGETTVTKLTASNCIFTETVDAEQRQTGCVRYSFVPLGSRVPRRFHCVPRDATTPVAPAFTSLEFGHPAFAQLARGCPPEITGGADDEGELGVWNFLQQPRRVANLSGRLDEYLRFGLEAGIFYAT